MSRWIYAALGLALALAPGCVHRARTGPYVWQLRGAVVSVSSSLIQVRHKTGQVVDVRIDDETVFVKDNQAESWQSLRRGTRVMVDVETGQSGVWRARRVQLFGGGRPG